VLRRQICCSLPHSPDVPLHILVPAPCLLWDTDTLGARALARPAWSPLAARTAAWGRRSPRLLPHSPAQPGPALRGESPSRHLPRRCSSPRTAEGDLQREEEASNEREMLTREQTCFSVLPLRDFIACSIFDLIWWESKQVNERTETDRMSHCHFA